MSHAVVHAVADAQNVSPLDLDPLITVLDPDALETLVASMHSKPDEPTGTVNFAYSGCLVTVTEDGAVSVRDQESLDGHHFFL